jgi:hypothetical protein
MMPATTRTPSITGRPPPPPPEPLYDPPLDRDDEELLDRDDDELLDRDDELLLEREDEWPPPGRASAMLASTANPNAQPSRATRTVARNDHVIGRTSAARAAA